tara:strand:- start:1166 stop:1723 length:558 start_codon:yes stop_codon:yes gene_type:complete
MTLHKERLTVNIFTLHTDPCIAARMQCDKHVVKMPLESAQMLASALRRYGATDIDMPFTKAGKPYGNSHPHHPCTVWAGDTRNNFTWLCDHGLALCEEYTHRYGKSHACGHAIRHMIRFSHLIPEGRRTRFVQAMPDEYKIRKAPVIAYRRYYKSDKAEFATWDKGREAPLWWTQQGATDENAHV